MSGYVSFFYLPLSFLTTWQTWLPPFLSPCLLYCFRLILTGSYDNKVRVWNESQQCLCTLSGHTRPLKSLCWASEPSPDSPSLVLSGSDDSSIKLWKVQPNEGSAHIEREFNEHTGSVTGLAINKSLTRVSFTCFLPFFLPPCTFSNFLLVCELFMGYHNENLEPSASRPSSPTGRD